MEISEIESPFKPLMAEGDGSPLKSDLIDFDDRDLMEFVSGEVVFEGDGMYVNSVGKSGSCESDTVTDTNSSTDSIVTGSDHVTRPIPSFRNKGQKGRVKIPTEDIETKKRVSAIPGTKTSCRKLLFDSPIKKNSPNVTQESFSSFLDISGSSGIAAETFFGSLFSLCDTQKIGKVRVSKLLDLLLSLQEVKSDLNASSSSNSESLEALKDILDPSDKDPLIGLNTFKKAWKVLLKSRNEQNKESDEELIRGDDMDNVRLKRSNGEIRTGKFNGAAESSLESNKWSLQNSTRQSGHGNGSRLSLLDMSHLSSRSGSFEALGGNTSVPDPWDLQTEISELKFHNQKLTDECSELQQQVALCQEENIFLLSQKEELDKRLSHRDLAQEKIKQLHRELDETRHIISSSEDLNSVLSSRIQRLERDYAEVELKNNELKKDYDGATADLENCLTKIRQKEDEIEKVRVGSEEIVQTFMTKEKRLEEKLCQLNEALDELTSTNNQLRREKFELESNLVDISGNQFAQLNSPSENGSIYYGESEEINGSYLHRSLHAEIAATLERRRSIPQNFLFRRDSLNLMDASTQSETLTPQVQENDEKEQKAFEKYIQLFTLVKDVRELMFHGSSEIPPASTDVEAASGATDRNSVTGNGALEEGIKDGLNVESMSANISSLQCSSQDEMVRRINQELAEFRQQLKKSQELFHALQSNGSATTISLSNVTQSCPVLADSSVAITASTQSKPTLVCCSTQTESSVVDQQPRRSSMQQDGPIRSLLDAIDDMDGEGEGDGNYLDKLSDDISYRLTINLPTVLEESEQETETSPGAGPRRMSSCDKGRRRLVRMPNATEEETESNSKREEEEAFKSDNDYASAASSLPGSINNSAYNSLERPLTITGAYRNHRNGDSDSASLVSASEGNTTYGSPLSYPSSPTYYTPSQGSSSQETITNLDGGDKTPVNDYDATEKYEVQSCPGSRTENGNGGHSLRKPSSSWGPLPLPMYNKPENYSIGVIPESQKQHMIMYAYDPVTRNSEEEASILTNREWQTLRIDLDKQAQDNYRKRWIQEEGNDFEGGSAIECGSQKPYNSTDLDEEAEEYLEKFPNLVEELFKNLDLIKDRGVGPSESELGKISKRFEYLAFTFQTEHITLDKRKEIKLKELDTSRNRMHDTISLLSSLLQELDDVSKTHKVPDDISRLSCSLKHIVGDLSMHSTNLSKTSRRRGMMDVQIRLYKMIEVMVLYVHILRNLYDNVEKDLLSARKLLEDNKIEFSSSRASAQLNNNNNNEKVSWDEGQQSEGESKSDEGRPRFSLQRLLGPKKSNVGLDLKLKEKLLLKEKKSSTNVVIRCIADTYETLRCELFWPWNWEETSRGIKQLFSIILMIVGLFIISRSVLPNVSANTDPEPMVADLSSIFSKYGDLNHDGPPLI